MPKGIYKRNTNLNCGMSGRKHSDETKRKIGEKSKGRKANWKGGKTIDSNGYVWIYKPNHPNAMRGKYVFEHRLIMEDHIGRYLLTSEEVHHINNNKQDNRIENLKLFENKSAHRKEDWKSPNYKGRWTSKEKAYE